PFLPRGEDELEVVAVHGVDAFQYLALALKDTGLLAGLDVDLVDERLGEAVRTAAGTLAARQVHVPRGRRADHVRLGATSRTGPAREIGPATAAQVGRGTARAREEARPTKRS